MPSLHPHLFFTLFLFCIPDSSISSTLNQHCGMHNGGLQLVATISFSAVLLHLHKKMQREFVSLS